MACGRKQADMDMQMPEIVDELRKLPGGKCWPCLEAAAEIERLRLSAAACLAEKAEDWKAACESAFLASKKIASLRLTDEEREVLGRVADDASYRSMEWTERVVRGLLERLK